MSDRPEERGWHLAGGLAEARDALVAWVEEGGAAGRIFLEAHLSMASPGVYRVRHRRDVGVADLECHGDPYAARAIAQTTESGEHRPLKTAPTLKRGWSLEPLDARGLWTALDYLYPACAAHWYAGSRGALRVTHWRETAARQSGMYSAVGLLADAAVRNVVRACCGDQVCMRALAWGVDQEDPEPLATDLERMLAMEGPPPGDARVPCPEACSVFISLARKVLTLERSPAAEIPGYGEMRGMERDGIRGMVLAATEEGTAKVREGDFGDEANARRVRYLAAKLLTEER